MKAEDMIKSRSVFHGTEQLLDMGGVIRKGLESAYSAIYPAQVLNAVKRHCDYGPEFWLVADTVTAEYIKEMESGNRIPAHFGRDPRDRLREKKRLEWFLNQEARLEFAKLADKDYLSVQDMDLPEGIKEALSDLNALDERLVSLKYGFKGEALSAEEIAALSEFNCSLEFIRKRLDRIEYYTMIGVLMSDEDDEEDFDPEDYIIEGEKNNG